MHFRLDDGKPVWAIAKTVIDVKIPVLDEQGEEATETVQQEIYLYTEEEFAQYPDAEPIEQPTPEILSRAAQIEGMTLSKSEFERMLFEKTKEEQLQEQVESLQNEKIDLQLAIAEMAESHEQEKIEMQLALAELAEMIGGE